MQQKFRKRTIAILLIIALMCSVFMLMPSATPPTAGENGFISPIDGIVPADAIRIVNANIRTIDWTQLGGYYYLGEDINLTSEWVPIEGFQGTFDGRGHTVSNLYVLSSSRRQYAGLFGNIAASGAVIKNVGVTIGLQGVSASTSSDACAGGLIGICNNTAIENCYAMGSVSAYSSTSFSAYAGGLVGRCTATTIENCYTTGNVSAFTTTGSSFNWHSAYAGGLIGHCDETSTINCYATGNVYTVVSANGTTGVPACAGGLIARGYTTIIKNCYATGNVLIDTGSYNRHNSNWYAGGLVGSFGGTIENSYAAGEVSADSPYCSDVYYAASYIAGLVGYCADASTITNCFSTSNISVNLPCNSSTAGLIGLNRSSLIENCYATGDVTSVLTGDNDINSYSGGLIGQSLYGKITHCYSTGNVSVTGNAKLSYAGGLIGDSSTPLEKCYAVGNVTSNTFTTADYSYSYAGGMTGYTYGTIKNCYAVGNVTSNAVTTANYSYSYAGGITGYTYGTIENSYAVGDVTSNAASALNNSIYAGGITADARSAAIIKNCYRLDTQAVMGNTINTRGEPLDDSQMKARRSFTDWDFAEVWGYKNGVNSNYPVLRVFYDDIPVYVLGVTLDRDAVTIIIGDTDALRAAVYPADAADQTVTWSSSDTSVATVDSYGEITAVGSGTATVTVATVDSGFTAECTVTVKPILTGIYVETLPANILYTYGETIDLTGLSVTAVYSDGSETAVTDYIIYPGDGTVLDTVGTVTFYISYGEDDIERTTYFSVTVNANLTAYITALDEYNELINYINSNTDKYTANSLAGVELIIDNMVMTLQVFGEISHDSGQDDVDAAAGIILNVTEEIRNTLVEKPVNVVPSAFVDKLNGNMNRLTINITEIYSDGSTKNITEIFIIANNAADTYIIGEYGVYVDTKGNNQIRACSIVF